MNRFLDRWLVIGLTLIVAVLILSAVLDFGNTKRLNEDAGWVAHTHQVLDRMGDVLQILVSAESEQRGYLITGREEFLLPYSDAVKQVAGQIAVLRSLTADNDEQQKRIGRLEVMVAARLKVLQEAVDIRRKKGEGLEERIMVGKKQMDAIRRHVAQMEDAEQELLASREALSLRAYILAQTSALLSAALGLVMVGAFYWLLRRSLAVRHNAALAIHEHHEWLQTTLTSIGDAVIATDAGGRVKFLNRVAEGLTGWKSDDAVGRPLPEVFAIINETTRKETENPALRALRDGRVVGLANHTVLIAKDGSERAIDDTAAPMRDRAGHIAGVVLVFRDVTEQRRAAASAQLLAAVVDGSDDAIISKDIHGIVTSWNQAAERIFGYPAAEAVGRPISMLAPADRPDEMPGILARIRSGERVEHFDTIRRAKDGRLIPISLTVSPIRDAEGNIIGASKIARDVSERKQAELALQEEKARLQTTLVSIGDAVIVTDPQGRITLINPVAQALTGWKEEAVGRLLDEVFHIVNEKTRKPAVNPAARVLREGVIVGLANHTTLIGKDASERAIDDSAAPVRDNSGRVAGVVLVFRDITERRKTEGALQEANRRKDEFLATLAHELRNPLAPIRNALELLRRADGDKTLLEQARGLMGRQLDQLVRLVDDLLDLSRISRGRISLRKERVELASVIHTAVEAVRPAIDAEKHILTVNLPPEPVTLDADPTRLAQILLNLLSNSAKYTEQGGHIWLSTEKQNGDIMISVRDTGIGIAPEHLPHIFEMFSQVAPALERSQGGLGIGLALVRGLVELHGGQVEARSQGPGQGSEFIVRLPVVASSPSGNGPERALSAPAPAGDAAPARKCRILVVDDNRDAADSLALVLQMTGHEIKTAYDGREALEAAATFHPEAILLDIGLPKINGYDVARRLRQESGGKELTLIALTGWGQDEDKRRALEAGFDHHLTKPVEIGALEKLLTSVKGC